MLSEQVRETDYKPKTNFLFALQSLNSKSNGLNLEPLSQSLITFL